MSSSEFLLHKLYIAFLYFTTLNAPVIISALICFTDQWYIFSCIQFLAYAYITAAVLAKYASYPYAIQIPLGILIAFCVIMPFLLLMLIPFLWIKSTQKLKYILP